MDSLTQLALGAAVGTAVMGRRAGARAALWGAAMGTLPDLDTLIAYGDPVRDFTFHRAESHALFWLTLAAIPLAALVHRLTGAVKGHFQGWLLATWLALITHPLLDAFTVYGTQLLLPFSDMPLGVGSIFIIDPLYTLPLLAGLVAAIALSRRRPALAQGLNVAGLALSTAYLGWSAMAQAHVTGVVHRTVAATPLATGRVLVTPTPFNTVLWRVVVMDETGYHEGFYSLLDGGRPIDLVRHSSEPALLDGLREDWAVRRLAWFSKGFYAVSLEPAEVIVATEPMSTVRQLFGQVPTAAAAGDDADERPRVVMSDLRMGQTPWFVFTFVVGAQEAGGAAPVEPLQLPSQRPPAEALGWLFRRILDPAAGPLPGQPATQAPTIAGREAA
ncbi:MAG: metal-dependent hydrolase [Steroidobacteraceae bacterium]|jgi:inner membrane protein|nr:metal-dependent hydrolase [Steroidobacteraceae bacterium]